MPEWIIREKMSEVINAIRATDGSTHVFYLSGTGGTGKTVFLRQIGQALGSGDGIQRAFPWSGILDLYHSSVNTNSGLEGRLCDALERAGEFQEYRAEREAFAARREAGETGLEMEVERDRLSKIFAQCFGQVTLKKRVVVALDTTERIQYDTDDLQRLFGLDQESTAVKIWLMEQLRKWENCVVLLAGRRDADLEKLLEEKLAGTPAHYHPLEWEGFTEKETQDFFERQGAAICEAFDMDLRRRLWQITEGKPIRLELAIYVAQHELGWDKFVTSTQGKSPREIQDSIDQLLIKHVMESEPDPSIRTLLRYLALARKGLDARLLHCLAGEWSEDECQRRLAAIADRPFIKRRLEGEEERFFLHDEMYELCDKYLLEAPEVQEKSRQIAGWYDEQIKIDLAMEGRQNYQVDSLLYRLRADPWAGYQWYAMTADEAIRYAEVGFEMRMRHELLSFLQSSSVIDRQLLKPIPDLPEAIDCDCAGRWVKRYMSRGLNSEAVRIGKMVEEREAQLYPAAVPGSRLALADFKVYYAQALIYMGYVQEGIALLKEVIAELEGERKPEDVAWESDPLAFAGWRRNLVLGRAHNNLGYAYRQPGEPHYRLALQESRRALPYFRASGLQEELANTSDNMGRVHAQLYERSRAEVLIDDSLTTRKELGREFRTGLSLVSRAIAYLMFDEPHRARLKSEEALTIFERLGGQRGIGLASLTLGRSLRKLGDLGVGGLYPPAEADKFFQDAIRHLKRAADIFGGKAPEPAFLLEAYDELGCACRGRAALARLDPKSPLARSVSREAVEYLTTCVEEAKKKEFLVIYVDACEDLAETFFQRQDYDYTSLWLQRAEEPIPDQYKIKEGVGIPKISVEDRVEEYWQLMGKIELLRGFLVYQLGLGSDERKITRPVLVDAMQHFAFAVAYFERYSERTTGLDRTLKQLHNRLKACDPDDLKYIWEDWLPAFEKTYALDPSRMNTFFEDTLGLD